VLTVKDTFTRYVLHGAVGYTINSDQVKSVWEFVIAEYLQEAKLSEEVVDINNYTV